MENSAQYFDLIFLGVIAVALILRLRGQLGKRNGNEKPSNLFTYEPKNDNTAAKDKSGQQSKDTSLDSRVLQFLDTQKTISSKAATDTSSSKDAITYHATTSAYPELQPVLKLFPTFDAEGFLGRAEDAFAFIVDCFARGDRTSLKPFVEKGIYDDLEYAITDREQAGETLMMVVERFLETRILHSELQGSKAVIKVLFRTEQAIETKDKDNKVVAGDNTQLLEKADVWTFRKDLRKNDPTWVLIATDVLDADNDGAADKPTSITV